MTIKILSMLLLGVSLVTTSATSYAVGYGAIGGGVGGVVKAPNVSIEVGTISTALNTRNQIFAGEFGFIFNADNVPKGSIICLDNGVHFKYNKNFRN